MARSDELAVLAAAKAWSTVHYLLPAVLLVVMKQSQNVLLPVLLRLVALHACAGRRVAAMRAVLAGLMPG